MSTPGLVEHFFRHEYGRLVASLSHRVGIQHLEAVEDAVQSALMKALDTWTTGGTPDNPSAWLFRVAHNSLLGELRQASGRLRILDTNSEEHRNVAKSPSSPSMSGDVRDDLLRMLFVCCDEAIPIDSQLALALKTLCGFSVREISLRLFASEAKIYKRLERARASLRQSPRGIGELNPSELSGRRSAVHQILYLLFTEGHLSSHADEAIRRELCDEAIRLAEVLVEHPVGQTPETFALLALMHLHASRLGARVDLSGGLLLLEEQDRGKWDRQQIAIGLDWLARSSEGDVVSRYHAEAGIAAEHCMAPSFSETRWDRVAECYALLEHLAPSALHRLNRAVAVAECEGPAAGLALLEGFEPPTWLVGSYLWSAVLADLHRRNGQRSESERYRQIALRLAPTPAIKSLLQRRLAMPGP